MGSSWLAVLWKDSLHTVTSVVLKADLRNWFRIVEIVDFMYHVTPNRDEPYGAVDNVRHSIR